MTITLPLPPNLANARMHWRTKAAAWDAYYLACVVSAPKRPAKPMPRARISATLYVWSRMDGDNLVARLKYPVDFLVRRGYLVDDGPDYLEWTIPTQVVDRKNQRVEITLEAM